MDYNGHCDPESCQESNSQTRSCPEILQVARVADSLHRHKEQVNGANWTMGVEQVGGSDLGLAPSMSEVLPGSNS